MVKKSEITDKYHRALNRINTLQTDLDIWVKRAIYAEKRNDTLNKINSEYLQEIHNKDREIAELKQKMPANITLSAHIENLIQVKETYRRLLIGENVGFFTRLKVLWLILKGGG